MIKDTILNMFFPKYCLGCGKEESYVCKDCELFILDNLLICPACGYESLDGKTHKECLAKSNLDGLISVWDYNGIVKEMIQRAKDKGEYDMINDLVNKFKILLSDDSTGRFQSFLVFINLEETVITFKPITKKELRERGFNQSELIARAVGKMFGKRPLKIIEKTEGKDFRIKSKLLTKKIVLVDDLFITGRTMIDCSRILRLAGAEQVWGFVLARKV